MTGIEPDPNRVAELRPGVIKWGSDVVVPQVS